MNFFNKRNIAEGIATLILVVIGVGGAAFVSGGNPYLIALSFALGVIVLAYSVGYISGGHANPSISLGFLFSGRLSPKDTLFYIIWQIIGALVGGLILYIVSDFDSTLIAQNQVADGYNVLSAGLVEFVITFIFVSVVLRVTRQENLKNIAPLIIGITLGMLVAFALNITNGSLNFARSLSVDIYSLDGLKDLWIFLIFPSLGGICAGLVSRFLIEHRR